jgi:hypothetical protein
VGEFCVDERIVVEAHGGTSKGTGCESSPNFLHQRCDELTVRPLSKRTRTVVGGESCASAAERVSVFNSRWILQQKQTRC